MNQPASDDIFRVPPLTRETYDCNQTVRTPKRRATPEFAIELPMLSALQADSEFSTSPREPNRFIPGWMVSAGFHGLLFALMLLGSRRVGTPEGSGEAFHDVGLVAKADLRGSDRGPAGSSLNIGVQVPAEGLAEMGAIQDPLLAAESPSVTSSVLPLQLPGSTVATIGAGPPLPTTLTTGSAALRAGKSSGGESLRGIGGIRGLGTGGLGNGSGVGGGGGSGPRFGRSDGASFFQAAAQGNRFYYVVDCSASMDDHNAIGFARAEMMASIERLDPGKQFQILFYNGTLWPMMNGKQDVFFATDINRTFARQFVNNQEPDGGTDHKAPLIRALRSGPDVIFYLSDGDTPPLTKRDLEDLRAADRNNTQIHVVQFGKGAKVGPTNWLEQIAKDHHGTYRYRDVTQFRSWFEK